MPIWAVFGRLFQLLEQLVDRLQLFLDLQRLRNGQRRAAGELVLAGQLVDLVLVAQPGDQLHQLPGERRAVVAGLIPQPLQLAKLLVAKRLLEALLQVRRRLDRLALLAIGVGGPLSGPCAVSYFSRIFRFRSSSIARSASRLGPRPAIWLGSRWIARASSSSVSSRMLPYISRCSKAGETRSGGGCVGLGKFSRIELLVGVDHAAETRS